MVATSGILLFPQSHLWAQGSLTPPGAPAPTFKTLSQLDTKLDQISNYVYMASNSLSLQISQAEPRIPIPGSLHSGFNAQLDITAPGSYYLTTNLYATNASFDMILVLSNDVTIDLNGFSIVSTNPPGAPSPAGIRISASTNVTVRNGQINGFDRAVKAQLAFYGVLVDNIHALNCSRAGIEADGIAGDATQTLTVRQCVVENINSAGEGASAAADGIALVNCTAMVDSCVVRDITPTGGSLGTCINFVTATNSFANNNFLSHATVGLNVSGGGTRVYYRNNLTAGCGTAFTSSGGVDRGGNF